MDGLRVPAGRGDLVVAAALLLVAGYVLLEASRMPGGSGPVPGPGLVPGLLAAALAVVAVALGLRARRAPPSGGVPIRLGHPHGLVVLVGLALVTLVLERLGFGLTLGVYLLVLFRRLSGRSWTRAAVAAAITVGAALAVFQGLLGVALPRGSWWG